MTSGVKWHDMDLIRLVKQVLQLLAIWQLQSLSLMVVALALLAMRHRH